MAKSGAGAGVALLELLGAISLATDLANGQPTGHGLRSSVLATAVARELGLADSAVADVQRVALLRFLGCTADAPGTAALAGGDDVAFMAAMSPVNMGSKGEMGRRLVASVGPAQPRLRKARLVARALGDPQGAKRSLSAHCEVAAMLSTRLAVGAEVTAALAHGMERWDGQGFPDGLRGEAVPQPVRIAVVARDADLWWRHGRGEMEDVLRARRGRAYDPAVADACLAVATPTLEELDAGDPWAAIMGSSPGGTVGMVDLDVALESVADFVDLKSAWTVGHSRGVAELAAAAGTALGMRGHEVTTLRHAGLVHDLGQVAVPTGIWDRPGPLGVADRERVRLHPYLTERTLACCPSLEELGRLAGSHHERLDCSGYHRGSRELGLAERVLAAADVVAALNAARPHRPPATQDELAAIVREEVVAGRLDRTALDAVLAAAGHRPLAGRDAWPAGLTDREVEVLRLLTRGQTNKEVAALLHLSVKTVGRHVENAYAKIGVGSRAAAAVFVMQHRLLD